MSYQKYSDNSPSKCLSDDDPLYPNYMALLSCILHKNLSVSDGLRLMDITPHYQKEEIWCVANDRAFGDDATVRFGVKEGASRYYVTKFALDDALQKRGYPIEKCMTGFFERGYMPMFGKRRQVQKKQGGVSNRYYLVELQESTCNGAKPLN